MLDKLKKSFKQWRDRRFLKRHGCETWNEYNHRYDPDIFQRACRVADYYTGYPYVYCFDNRDHYAYSLLYDYGPGGCRHGYDEIVDWCRKNTKHKHRTDIHRVLKHNGIGLDGSYEPEWWFNEIGGGDYLFFAFKDEKEYTWFVMRWA